MKKTYIASGAGIAVAAAAAYMVLSPNPPEREWKIRHQGVYYSSTWANPSPTCDPNPYPPPANYQFRNWFADHYEGGTVPESANFDAMKARNPNFRGFTYKSVMDNYGFYKDGVTLHPEELALRAICDSLGVPIESCYLHWADTTTVMLYGNVPSTYPAGARVEINAQGHQNAGYRFACCFLPVARPAHTEHFRQRSHVKSTQGREWDGVFGDNCGTALTGWTSSTLVKGGHVVEAGGLQIGTTAFNNWWWANLVGWLQPTKATLNREGKQLSINVSSYWSEAMLDSSIADQLLQEFIGNWAARDWFPDVPEVARRHTKAEQKGVEIVSSAGASYLGNPCLSYNAMAHAALCGYLVTAGKFSYYHLQDWTGPYRPDWPKRAIAPADSLAGVKLRKPTGSWEIYKQGTSPKGKPYKIYARPFEGGMAFIRPWGGMGQPSNDVVAVVKPWNMIELKPDATYGQPDSIRFTNGGGAILVRP